MRAWPVRPLAAQHPTAGPHCRSRFKLDCARECSRRTWTRANRSHQEKRCRSSLRAPSPPGAPAGDFVPAPTTLGQGAEASVGPPGRGPPRLPCPCRRRRPGHRVADRCGHDSGRHAGQSTPAGPHPDGLIWPPVGPDPPELRLVKVSPCVGHTCEPTGLDST